MAIEDLRRNAMMSHLLDALDRGDDIGHYGRLVFAMVARHFLSEDELCTWLAKNVSDDDARSLCRQVEGRDYNPPRRQRILQWQQEQSFPICPDAADPDSCNVYRDLKFPDHVYEHIQEYYEQKAEAHGESGAPREAEGR
jgi:DNA primase large subunit